MTPMRSAFISTAIGTAASEQHELVPDRAAVEHGEDVGEAHDREEVAQARAGLGHLQLVDAEVDDVAVEEDRHAHQPRRSQTPISEETNCSAVLTFQ